MDTLAIQQFLDTSSLYFFKEEEAVELARPRRRQILRATPRVFSFLEDVIKYRSRLKMRLPTSIRRTPPRALRAEHLPFHAAALIPPCHPEIKNTGQSRFAPKRLFLGLMLATAVAVALVGGEAFAADPSLHQVYAAAEAGKTAEALSMMEPVLRDHPDSAKAHYVEAELLAKAGRMDSARGELGAAENLAPGLPFANAEAVQNLKSRLSPPQQSTAPLAATNTGDNFPSDGAIFLMGGLLVFLFFAARALVRRAAMPAAARSSGRFGGGGSLGVGQQPYAPAGVSPMAPAPSSGGVGSGVFGGLATGVAVGAGLVAGEALAHNLLNGSHQNNGGDTLPLNDTPWSAPANNMGGNDFGIADGGSWDDVGGGGGDDWS